MRLMKGEAPLGGRPARLVIADQCDLFRESLRVALEGEANIEVVGEAKDGREALEMCCELRPDLVLMDLRMPRVDGLEATHAIKEQIPGVSVVILTLLYNLDYILEAIQLGVGDYVPKDASLCDVLSTVWRVLSGEPALSESSTLVSARIEEIAC